MYRANFRGDVLHGMNHDSQLTASIYHSVPIQFVDRA